MGDGMDDDHGHGPWPGQPGGDGGGSGSRDGGDGGMDIEAIKHRGADADLPHRGVEFAMKASTKAMKGIPVSSEGALVQTVADVAGLKKLESTEVLNSSVDANAHGGSIGAVLRGNAYWDDVRGGWLDQARVREARLEELSFMRKERLWDVVPRSRAVGHRVVSVRWVDTDKGSEDKPEIRSRLVARDFNGGWDRDREDPSAATPPWELKRLLLSLAADTRGEGGER